MKDTALSLLAGLTGPELAFASLFLGLVFAAGVGFGLSVAASLPRRRGNFIPPHRRF